MTNKEDITIGSNFADLAEKYLADAEYPVGTVMAIGGEAEVTAASKSTAHSVLGVVSAAPAYLMNKDLEGGTVIALKGRVPVRVQGEIRKGDRLSAYGQSGVAVSNNAPGGWTFAIALESWEDEGEGLVEAVIL